MKADGSNQHLLLGDPSFFDFAPSFSPDGSQVVFTRCQPGGNCALYRVNVDGTGVTAITNFNSNPDVNDFEAIRDILKPYDANFMRRYPVSRKLNSSKIDDAEAASPVILDTPTQAKLF